jgi:NTE family protein
MLVELIAADVRPELIVGVSAGALNGTFLAYDPSPSTVERIAELWRRISTREARGLSWQSLLGVIGLRGHIADARGLRRLLDRELPYREFSATQVQLHIVAADEASGAEVLLNDGSVAEAVLASTAIPGVFAPVVIAGRRAAGRDGADRAALRVHLPRAGRAPTRRRARHARDQPAGRAPVAAGF